MFLFFSYSSISIPFPLPAFLLLFSLCLSPCLPLSLFVIKKRGREVFIIQSIPLPSSLSLSLAHSPYPSTAKYVTFHSKLSTKMPVPSVPFLSLFRFLLAAVIYSARRSLHLIIPRIQEFKNSSQRILLLATACCCCSHISDLFFSSVVKHTLV